VTENRAKAASTLGTKPAGLEDIARFLASNDVSFSDYFNLITFAQKNGRSP
jgi:hypothetical protein